VTAIVTHGLRKVYPVAAAKRMQSPAVGGFAPPPRSNASPAPPSGARELVALDGLDLEVRAGEFFGLLGPNGAGKTTTIGILTTRVLASAGDATVGGADVIRDPVSVRRRIGVVPQRANPDRGLNVLENLVFHSAYFGIPRAESTQRALALLEQLGMSDKAHEKVDALSGGQQQRLMIARALIHEPDVIFLDEPTVGLDPQARLSLWEILRTLHRAGRTIVMTTHYMEEADQLCDRLAIIDRGHLLALDTPAALKARAPGGTLIELDLDGPSDDAAVRARALQHVTKAEATGDTLRVHSAVGGRIISAVIEAAESAGRHVRNITLKEPSLETLFIELTGRKLE
jgi:ABC-2 type transport system ATP-binding protein